MRDTGDMQPSAGSAESSTESKWPRVLGTVGMVLGAIMAVDMIDDLFIHLVFSEEDWAEWVGSDIASLIARSMPPIAWRLGSAIVQIALGVLLIVGSLRLRRRQASGVRMCRLWAMLTVVWSCVVLAPAFWWMDRFGDHLPGVSAAEIQGAVAFGLVIAAAFLLAYPVFLLLWFSKKQVRTEIGSWPADGSFGRQPSGIS